MGAIKEICNSGDNNSRRILPYTFIKTEVEVILEEGLLDFFSGELANTVCALYPFHILISDLILPAAGAS